MLRRVLVEMVLARVHYQHACIAACLAGRNHNARLAS